MATLQSFVDRIENLDAEQKGIGTDKRDVFDEADAAGFDKKAIRRLLRDRREAAKDKGTAALAEQYKMLLSEPGATYRSVAEKTGAKRSTIHRRVQRNENGTDYDPATGEVTEWVSPTQAYIAKFTETAPDTPGEGAGTTDKPDGPGSALATIFCEVDGGKPCPNTCARQGSCVWAPAETGSATRSGDGLGDALSPVGDPPVEIEGYSTEMALPSGLEPETIGVEIRRSVQLSYASEPSQNCGPDATSAQEPPRKCMQLADAPRSAACLLSTPPQPDSCSTDADRLRAQIPSSTDPARLEREAEIVEAREACRECGEAWHGGDCAPVPDVQPRALTPVEIGDDPGPMPARLRRTVSA